MNAPSGEDTLARVVWSVLAEPGDAVAGELAAALGPAESLALVRRAAAGGASELLEQVAADASFADGPDRVRAALESAFDRWRPRLGGADDRAVAAMASATAVGARLLVPGTPEWPSGLEDLGPHAPFVLWSRSELDDPVGAAGCRGALAIVGCRANTVAGAEATAEIASVAADDGVEIVSGGAYGIDAVAHRVAVAAGTPTTAVLAGGVDQFYPAGNHDLLRNVLGRGRVLSESPPGTRPTRWRFLQGKVKCMRPVRISHVPPKFQDQREFPVADADEARSLARALADALLPKLKERRADVRTYLVSALIEGKGGYSVHSPTGAASDTVVSDLYAEADAEALETTRIYIAFLFDIIPEVTISWFARHGGLRIMVATPDVGWGHEVLDFADRFAKAHSTPGAKVVAVSPQPTTDAREGNYPDEIITGVEGGITVHKRRSIPKPLWGFIFTIVGAVIAGGILKALGWV